MQSLLAIAVDVCSGVQKPIISVARVFLRKMLGTRYKQDFNFNNLYFHISLSSKVEIQY